MAGNGAVHASDACERKLTVGLGEAGMRYLGREGALPAGVQLVPLAAAGPLPSAAGDIEFMILSGAEFPVERVRKIFEVAQQIRVVQTLSAGVDKFLPLLRPGMALHNASGTHDIAVAEWCMAVILAHMRQLPAFLACQARGHWSSATREVIATGRAALGVLDDLEARNAPFFLADKHVFILGHGSIGRALEARLRPFGARVTGFTRGGRDGTTPVSELPALLPGADVVVVLLPLTPATRGVVDGDFLGRMRRGALLVNAGRGAHVVTDALVDALHHGHVRAALDVTDPEPLPEGHALWSSPGVIITPHIGGAVARMRERGYRLVTKQIRRHLAGEPLQNKVILD